MAKRHLLTFAFVFAAQIACATPVFAQTPAPEPVVVDPAAKTPDTSSGRPGPRLTIPIPDLKFSDVKVTQEGTSRFIDVPWIAEYISAIYKYAIGLAGLLATVMFMVGGFQYLTAGGDAARVTAGKRRITDAIVGMLLVLGTYTLLKVVNPDALTLSALHVQVVKKNSFKTMSGVLEVMGSTADEKAYASIPAPNSAEGTAPPQEGGAATTAPDGGPKPPPEVNPALPGAYRKSMWAACGNRDGLSLSTLQDKLDRLRTIVQTWKVIGSDQGGAIYTRGGNFDCTYSNPQPDFVLASMVTLASNGLHPSLSSECMELVTATVAKPDTAWETSKAHPECLPQWKAEYDRLIVGLPNKAGMACGDCVSFMISLTTCFDKSLSWGEHGKYRTGANCPAKDNPKYVFVLGPNVADFKDESIAAAVAKLQFGDMISWQKFGGSAGNPGHNFLYTGGAGLSFEMMEMGGGGKGDVSSAGGAKGSKNAGYKWTSAGVQAWSSAFTYLKTATKYVQPSGSQKGCIYAYRLIK